MKSLYRLLPSLNLGAKAAAVDRALLMGGVMGSMAGAKAMWPVTKRVASTSAKFLGTGALMTATLPITLGATAAVGAIGLGVAAKSAYNRMTRYPMYGSEARGNTITWAKGDAIPFTKGQRHFHTPMFAPRIAEAVGFGSLGAGIAGGVYDYQKSRGWNLSQALSTGAIEVEKPGFLGATGSLTLATHRMRHGRQKPHAQEQTGGMNLSRLATMHGDDALHMLHGLV
jgi:hypothetical protein